ncbi:MAG: hypothetical protein ACRCUJ_08215 [Phocaeicola sp.]
MKKLLLVGLVALSGCSARVQEIPHGNGGTGYVVECSGPLQRWGSCYKKASELCEGGTFEVSNAQAVTQLFGGAFVFSGTQDRSMVVKCDPDFDQLMEELQKQPFVKQ